MNPYSIILSADLSTRDELIKVAKATLPYIDGIKIHLSSLIFWGYQIINDLITSKILKDKILILDLKISDIGFLSLDGKFEGSNAKILEAVADLTPEIDNVFVTIHGFPGPVSIKECIEVGHKNDIKLLLIPYMSHVGADVFFDVKCGTKEEKEKYTKYGMIHSPDYQQTISETILSLGELYGVDGYIGPSNNLNVLHAYRRITQKVIVSPGFGRQANGVPFERQFYSWAKEVGPNSMAIIGSMIYKASNCHEVANYVKRIRDAFIDDISNSEPEWIVEGKVTKKEIPFRLED